MKEKISQYAKGIFHAKRPKVNLGVKYLDLKVEAGQILKGKFMVTSGNGIPIKGFITSTSLQMQLKEREFISERITFHYEFDAKYLPAGQEYQGHFELITDGGEFYIPFHLFVVEPTLKTSHGILRDLSDFRNLIKEDLKEAGRIFAAPEFKRVMLNQDPEKAFLYDHLIRSSSLSHALAEFFGDNEKDTVIAEEEASLNAMIHSEQDSQKQSLSLEYLKRKQDHQELLKLYLGFRTGQIDRDEYTGRTKVLIREFHEDGRQMLLYSLMEIHMNLIKQQRELVEDALGCLEMDSDNMKKDPLCLCYFHYLKALHHKKADVIEQAVEQIKQQLETDKNKNGLYYFIMLIYTDQRYTKDLYEKLRAIKDFFDAGCTSPLLYFEACNCYRQNSQLLSSLGTFERQAINWGIKYSYITEEVIEQFLMAAGKERGFHPVTFHAVKRLFEKKPKDDYIKVLCSILIKGNKTENKYNYYYSLGVNASLKLIGLNEYYIKSLDWTEEKLLPKSILIYFSYSDSLNENELAYLYHNILVHKEKYADLVDSYYDKINEFMKKQMERGLVNDHLIEIYNSQWEFILEDQELLGLLPNILFKTKISCKNPYMKGVHICHPEEKENRYIPLHRGSAYGDIYTKDVMLLFEDKDGRRYSSSVSYKIKPAFDQETYANLCYSYSQEDRRVLLYLGSKRFLDKRRDVKTLEIAKNIFLLPGIQKSIKMQCLDLLIECDKLNDKLTDRIEKYLIEEDYDAYTYQERSRLIEGLIIRNLYSFGRDAIKKYGCQDVPKIQLLKLVSHYLKEYSDSRKEFLTGLCITTFLAGYYDIRTLSYLCEFHLGSLSELIEIWKKAKEQGVSTSVIEENILAQSLFCKTETNQDFEVFVSYYSGQPQTVLVQAFLRYYAHQVILYHRELPDYIYQYIQLEIGQGVLRDDMSKMALLSYLSKKQWDESSKQKQFVRRLIHEFVQKGMVMPFFKAFADKINLPKEILIKSFISYESLPGKNVVVEYQMAGDDLNMVSSERMNEILPGVYVFSHLLFPDEELSYSIKEEIDHNVQLKKQGTLKAQDTKVPAGHRYQKLCGGNSLKSQHEAVDYIEKTELIKHFILRSQEEL